MEFHRKKIYQIASVFVLLLGLILLLFYLFISDYDRQIRMTTQERDGNQLTQSLYRVIVHTQRVRGMARFIQGNHEILAHYSREKQLLDESINEAHGRFSRYDGECAKEVMKNLATLKHQLELPLHTPQQVREHFHYYTTSIEKLLSTIQQIADRFGLILDPNKEAYYLIMLQVRDLPLFAEHLAYVRGLGSMLLLQQKASAPEMAAMENALIAAQNKLDEISGTTVRYEAASKEHHISSALEAVSTLLQKQEDVIASLADKGKADMEPWQFFVRLSQVIDEIHILHANNHKMLDENFQKRISSLKKVAVVGTLAVLGGVVLIGFIIMALMRSFNQFFRKEKELNEELGLMDTLKSGMISAHGLQEVASHALAVLIKRFGALEGVVYIYARNSKKLFLGATYGVDFATLKPLVRLGEGALGEAAKQQEVVWGDYQTKGHGGTIGLERAVVSGLATIPLIDKDGLVAVCQLGFAEGKAELDENILKKLTDLIATFIHDARIEEINLKYLDLVDRQIITSSTNEDGIIIQVSQAFAEISGYTKEELIGHNHNIVRHPDMPASLYTDMWKTISRGDTWHGEVKNRKKDGGFYWVDVSITPDKDYNGNILGYTAIRQDITAKKKVEMLSITDGLTGLYNRRYFDTVFPEQLAASRSAKHKCMLIIMDIDHFKQYNDTYGHQEGDNALKAVAEALERTMPPEQGRVFRLGGEEFGALAEVEDLDEAQALAETMRREIEGMGIPHKGNSASPYVTVSMGLGVVGERCFRDRDAIYKETDHALYKSKESGRNRITLANLTA